MLILGNLLCTIEDGATVFVTEKNGRYIFKGKAKDVKENFISIKGFPFRKIFKIDFADNALHIQLENEGGENFMYGKFTIDEKLPSLNEYINKCRTNKNGANIFKRKVENAIKIYIAKAKRRGELKEFDNTPCTISFIWSEASARRDVDNIQFGQKFVLDALKTYGIIKDDSQKYVKQTYHTVIKSDTDNSYVTVELKEYKASEE